MADEPVFGEVEDDEQFLEVKYPRPVGSARDQYSICFHKEHHHTPDWMSIRISRSGDKLMYITWRHLVEAAHAIIERDLRLRMERGDE